MDQTEFPSADLVRSQLNKNSVGEILSEISDSLSPNKIHDYVKGNSYEYTIDKQFNQETMDSVKEFLISKGYKEVSVSTRFYCDISYTQIKFEI